MNHIAQHILISGNSKAATVQARIVHTQFTEFQFISTTGFGCLIFLQVAHSITAEYETKMISVKDTHSLFL